MRLSVEEFATWAEDFYARAGQPFKKNVHWTTVARDANFGNTKLSMQRSRQGIDALTIINIARTYGLNPLDELARIPRWHQLSTMTSKPSEREILSSLHPRHIFIEMAERLGDNAPRSIKLDDWDSYYGRFSTWFDVTGGEAAKDRLAEAIQLTSPSAMSARLNSHTKFNVDDILDGFIPAQMDPIYALVLAGYITDTEAGYSPLLRQQTLVSVINDELLYMMQKQMRFTMRMLTDQQANERLINLIG